MEYKQLVRDHRAAALLRSASTPGTGLASGNRAAAEKTPRKAPPPIRPPGPQDPPVKPPQPDHPPPMKAARRPPAHQVRLPHALDRRAVASPGAAAHIETAPVPVPAPCIC